MLEQGGRERGMRGVGVGNFSVAGTGGRIVQRVKKLLLGKKKGKKLLLLMTGCILPR